MTSRTVPRLDKGGCKNPPQATCLSSPSLAGLPGGWPPSPRRVEGKEVAGAGKQAFHPTKPTH